MSRINKVILCTIVLCLVCACQTQDSPFTQITAGDSRERVLALVGAPDETSLLVKQGQSVRGPEEEWWQSIDMGTQLVIWRYEVAGGSYQIYFLRGDDRVSFTAFVDQNIVYESQTD